MRTCPTCRGPMRSARENYRYTASGLPDVVLRAVTVHRCPGCGEHEVEIAALAQLHQAIANAVANQAPVLAKSEIRFLRKYLGFSGADFAREMGVTPETVSRWENGALAMGLPAERLLRLMVLTRAPARNYHLASLGTTKRKVRITVSRRKGPWVAQAA